MRYCCRRHTLRFPIRPTPVRAASLNRHKEMCESCIENRRSIQVRWAKHSSNYRAFIELDSAPLWYRPLKRRTYVLG